MRLYAWAGALLLATVLTAQTNTVPQPAGVDAPWTARKIISDITAADEQIKPVLSGLNPQEWYDKKGASSVYIQQWQSAQQQLNDLPAASKLFSAHVDDLSAALDMYFRLESLETTARSVAEGADKYGTRRSAGELNAFIGKNFDARQRLREYIRDLATSVQQNFKIADEEAQRCRAAANQPCPSTRRSKR